MKFRDSICIKNLAVDCVVGVRPDERNSVQTLIIDLEMILDTEGAASTERLRASVDYSAISAQICFLLQNCRFRLLETAAHVLCRYLLMPPALGEGRSQIDEVLISLRKPDALQGEAYPVLTIHRTSKWVKSTSQKLSFGRMDDVYKTKNARIYRLNLVPNGSVTLHHQERMSESEMALTDGLLSQGENFPQGTIQKRSADVACNYQNPSSKFQSILCIEALTQG